MPFIDPTGRVLAEEAGMTRAQVLQHRKRKNWAKWVSEQQAREEAGPVLMTTSLAREVAPYYEHVPGGFEGAVEDALAAQEDRGDLRDILSSAPPWTKKEIYQDVPVRRKFSPTIDKSPGSPLLPPAGGGHYEWPKPPFEIGPGAVYVGLPDEYKESVNIFSFLRRPETDPWYTMPDYDEPIDQGGGVVSPPSYKSQEQKTLEHELSHSAYLSGAHWSKSSGRWRRPIPGGMGRDEDWDYRTTGLEQDPRLAEIKRAYSSATGKPVRTLEDAEDAWNWWGQYITHGSRGRREKVGSGWSKDIWERIENRPKERQRAIQRMRELVRSQLQDALMG